MGHCVICAFRPHPGKEAALRAVLRDHMPTLRSRGLITDRPAYLMKAKDGTLVEVFEWRSQEAVDAAHQDPVVQALWSRFDECCTCITLRDLPETTSPYPHFEPVNP